MAIKVEVTCAMCISKVDASLEKPLPPNWIKEKVKSPSVGQPDVEETFCCDGCKQNYQEAAPKAHAAAATDYTAKFWSVMNDLRSRIFTAPKK